MTDETPTLKALHEAYVKHSGRSVEFTMGRLQAWQLWVSHGWTLKDLEAVIAHVRKLISKGRKWESSLRFGLLIENTSNFEELLAEARAFGRIPKMDPGKREVLKATGRFEPVKARPRSVEEVLRDAKAFEDFKAFARSL